MPKPTNKSNAKKGGKNVKHNLKKQNKKATGKAHHKKQLKRKRPEDVNHGEETIQQKLQRFEEENRPTKKQKVEETQESEEELNAEDIAFFQTQGEGFVRFISGADDLSQPEKPNSKKKKKEEKNIPQEWEQTRVNSKWKEEKSKLPIKNFYGQVVEAPTEEDEKPKQTSEESEDVGDEEDDMETENPELVEVQSFVKREERIQIVKQQVASLASDILENPELRLRRLKELEELAFDPDDTVRKIVILSQLAIFLDILPGYKIREEKEEEEPGVVKVKLSKDVQKLQTYEKELLSHYAQYLKILNNILKNAPKTHFKTNAPKNTLTAMAVKCLSELLLKAAHFNLRSNVQHIVLKYANSSCLQICEFVQNACKALFKDERNSHASLEAVKKLCLYIKNRNYNVKPSLVNMFLTLPLTAVLPEGTDIFSGYTPKKKKAYKSKAQRKKEKEDKELMKEMKEAQAEQDKVERREIQTQTLKTIFLIYFRIIKEQQKSHLITVSLEGLSKFSHLINIELLLDIISLMKELIAKSELSIADKLHCVSCAFQTLHLQGDTLNVDLKDFYDNFYAILFDIISIPIGQQAKIMPVVIRCFDRMFSLRKELVLDRLAAFIKRIMVMNLYLQPSVALASLSIINRLFTHYPRLQSLLDTDSIGRGFYEIELDDPEHTNPFSSVLWEFVLLMQHAHPVLNNYSGIVAKQLQTNGPQHLPLYLYYFYGPNDDTKQSKKEPISYLYPELTPPTPGVLQKKFEKLKKSKSKNVYRAYFIHAPTKNSDFFEEVSKIRNSLPEDNVTEELQNYYEEMNSVALV